MTVELEQQLASLPTDPGIYQYFDAAGELIYVGKAVNLKNRVKSYFTDKNLSPKTQILVGQIARLETIVVHTEVDALILEANLIKQHHPRYNIILKDDKSHLYIRISLYESLPRISTCRATDLNLDPKATYFGPYPSSGTVKRTLRFLRRVFPYLAHHQPPAIGRRRPPQSFFYYNLPLGQTDAEIDQKRYRLQIFQLIRFLEGGRLTVAADLEKDMRQAAKALDFEHAAEVKKQLDGLNYMAQQTITPDSYISNPELVAEQRAAGLVELSEILIGLMNNYRPDLDQAPLHRVECYDISNIVGQQAVGSMVVFEDGEPLKSDYRKFKIKRDHLPNDVAMMAEVLRRRFKRLNSSKSGNAKSEIAKTDTSFESIPDLILVDGGKGQVTIANEVLTELGLDIPIAGLTKRNEELIIQRPEISPKITGLADVSTSTSDEIITDSQSTATKAKRSSAHGAIARSISEQQIRIIQDANFTAIRLARGTEALFFIQRIRDEAHRFAINYHRKLRSKNFLPK